ncbi:SLAM family member 5 [Cladorrhinum sp. PSN259]|nr:SLAM family member 5 [Cladorrhinum sp. PSN259]
MPSRRETLQAILDAHTEQNITKILAHHSEKSLRQPPLDNAAYKRMYQAIAPNFRNYQMSVADIFEDDKENKAVVWIHATADTDAGPYTNEKMLIFYFDDAGKVSRTLEFIDSAATAAFHAKLQEVLTGKAAVA